LFTFKNKDSLHVFPARASVTDLILVGCCTRKQSTLLKLCIHRAYRSGNAVTAALAQAFFLLTSSQHAD